MLELKYTLYMKSIKKKSKRKKSIATTPDRSRLMSRVRQSGTSLELAVRRIVDNLGASYETNPNDLPGTPDLVNRKDRWAIFVHGCFWHAHEGCKLSTIPLRNRDFWKKKFLDNQQRDKKKLSRLEELGYSTFVVWKCELENENELGRKIKNFLNMHERSYS